jgi:hypothetical protein
MMLFLYRSKKELKACVGQYLRYEETSMFGPEYKATGSITGANRPSITGMGREFFANVVMRDNRIVSVN